MDPDRSTCRTRFRHALAFVSGIVYGAPSRGSGGTRNKIPRRGRVISLDPAGLRGVVRLRLFLGLLDGNSVLVSDCRPLVCQGGILNVRSLVRSPGRQPFLSSGRDSGVDLDRTRLEPDRAEDWQVDGKYRRPSHVGSRVVAGHGGMDGVDASRFGNAHPYSSEMELGNRQFLGGDRLRDFRHGGPWHDGWGDP